MIVYWKVHWTICNQATLRWFVLSAILQVIHGIPLLPLPVVDGMDDGKSNIPAAIMATITIPRVEIPVTVAEAMVVV
jgi:hypothetical protein